MAAFNPAKIEEWALGYLARLAKAGVRGVLLGGSIARGQQWEHSDLEAGILVDEKNPAISYFNVDSGRGVEIIQLVYDDLQRQIEDVEKGDLSAVSEWPIQLYRARVISDPTGLLERFTGLFDRHLFSPPVWQAKLRNHISAGAAALHSARDLIGRDRPRAGLCDIRHAMNEAILALYWKLGELPRSQSRTDSRLRDLTSRHELPEFYELYREVFGLETTEEVIARNWPKAKAKALEIAALWNAGEFFETAVDGGFSWGEDGGILTVYRLYIPVIGRPNAGLFDQLDDRDWAGENQDLLLFLGLAHADAASLQDLADRVGQALERMDPQAANRDIRDR